MTGLPTTMGKDEILRILSNVKDPELPFIDIVELGIVRDVSVDGETVRVDITPTYSGCPALQVIEREARDALVSHGFESVEIRTVFSPAWTTDWMSEETKQKFRDYGIAPPGPAVPSGGIQELVSLRRAAVPVRCPYCGSDRTIEKSEFGSTACKSINFCESCRQPFDSFKAI